MINRLKTSLLLSLLMGVDDLPLAQRARKLECLS